MVSRSSRDGLDALLASMLRRPRQLPAQTLRHLDQHLDAAEASVPDFLARAARELEEYELEILFGPVFTPSFDEQVEVAGALGRYRPAAAEIPEIVTSLSRSVEICPVALPGGDTAPLALHHVLVERWVTLLRLDRAPDPGVVDSIRDSVAGELEPIALALLRGKGMTSRHQDWFARFLVHAADRHALDRETLTALAEFLAGQDSLENDDLRERLDGLHKASIEAGTFWQKGRMYWSSDVAEHHQFRGQGVVDQDEVERRMREIQVLDTLRADLESFTDVLG